MASYVYTYKEFVIVTEAPQCNKMTATGPDTDNKNNNNNIIKNNNKNNVKICNIRYIKNYIENDVCTGEMCKFEMKISMCDE